MSPFVVVRSVGCGCGFVERDRVVAIPLVALDVRERKDQGVASPDQRAQRGELPLVRRRVPQLARRIAADRLRRRAEVGDHDLHRRAALERRRVEPGRAAQRGVGALSRPAAARRCSCRCTLPRAAATAAAATRRRPQPANVRPALAAVAAGPPGLPMPPAPCCACAPNGTPGRRTNASRSSVRRPRRHRITIHARRHELDAPRARIVDADEGVVVALADERDARAVGRPARARLPPHCVRNARPPVSAAAVAEEPARSAARFGATRAR